MTTPARPAPGTWASFGDMHVLYFGNFRASLGRDAGKPATWWLRCPCLVLGVALIEAPGQDLAAVKQQVVQMLHQALVAANEDLRNAT
jgi:hypothetical protein